MASMPATSTAASPRVSAAAVLREQQEQAINLFSTIHAQLTMMIQIEGDMEMITQEMINSITLLQSIIEQVKEKLKYQDSFFLNQMIELLDRFSSSVYMNNISQTNST